MSGFTRRGALVKALPALVPAVAAAQARQPGPPAEEPEPTRLPNGKIQRDEILKADYEQNLRDARELMDLSKSFELDLEKSDRFVLSLALLKKLDDIEKLTKRIRGRMKR